MADPTQFPRDSDMIPRVKLVVVGDGGVGKSAVTIQYFQKNFRENHDQTIEDTYFANKCIDGRYYMLDVLDTAGQDEFYVMREEYMRRGVGFVVMFSVTCRKSFELLRDFHGAICRVKQSDGVPVVIVGNKIDLEHLRQVPTDEAQQFADELKVPYIETSARPPPQNIDSVFSTLVILVRNKGLIRELNPASTAAQHQRGGNAAASSTANSHSATSSSTHRHSSSRHGNRSSGRHHHRHHRSRHRHLDAAAAATAGGGGEGGGGREVRGDEEAPRHTSRSSGFWSRTRRRNHHHSQHAAGGGEGGHTHNNTSSSNNNSTCSIL